MSAKLSDHVFKKGNFIKPFNEIISELLKNNTWYYGRIPEYLLIVLILEIL